MADTTALWTPPGKAWLRVALYAPGFAAALSGTLRNGVLAVPALVLFGWLPAAAAVRATRPQAFLELGDDGFCGWTCGGRGLSGSHRGRSR